MATLVLTTVGGAIGGPIGAALGAAVGQAIDRNVLFPPKGRQGPRLTDLAVQTSAYATQIPKVFGTMRVAGCVIWATELIESRSRSRTGKGQPEVTGYSYAASFAVALSARPIRAVGRIWADGKLLRGAAGDWKAATGFRLHTGEEEQAADPLIASLRVDTPAHRGIAYAVFENLQLADFGNRIPSLTFEVIADDSAPRIGGIVRELGDGAIMGDGPDDAVAGYAASGDSVAGAIDGLATVAGAWFAGADGGIAMVNALGTPTVMDHDAGIGRTRRPAETVPVTLSLSHHDPARDYQVGVQQARRPGPGWREDRIDIAVAMDASRAKAVAESALLLRETARETRRVVTDARAIGLRPGDAVALDGETRLWRVAQASVERMQVTLDLVATASAVAPRAADPGLVLPAPDTAAGMTLIEVAELPLDDGAPVTPQLTIIAAGSAPGWRQAALLYSRDDGASWESVGATAAPATIGRLLAPLARAASTLVDAIGTIEVELAHDGMTLESVSADLLDRGANLALIGEELVQFRDATQVAPRRWRLATLLRGCRGTEPLAHGAGARFALIETDGIKTLSLVGAAIGQRVRVLASGVGDVAGPAEGAPMISGISIAPPAPVALSVRDGILTWRRRSRIGWRWRDGSIRRWARSGRRIASRFRRWTGCAMSRPRCPSWLSSRRNWPPPRCPSRCDRSEPMLNRHRHASPSTEDHHERRPFGSPVAAAAVRSAGAEGSDT